MQHIHTRVHVPASCGQARQCNTYTHVSTCLPLVDRPVKTTANTEFMHGWTRIGICETIHNKTKWYTQWMLYKLPLVNRISSKVRQIIATDSRMKVCADTWRDVAH